MSGVEEYNPYWETEEFEDLVTRGLIGLYETKIKKDKRGPKCNRFTEEFFAQMRKRGCYFPSHDRVIAQNFEGEGEDAMASSIQEIDILNDGLPPYAMWSSDPTGILGNEYLWTFYMERVKTLPKPFVKPRPGVVYRCMQVFFGDKVDGCGTFVVIDENGILESCYIPVEYNDPITGRPIKFNQRPRMIDNNNSRARDYYAAYASCAIQIFQDRRFLWNVTAKEGNAKAVFTVYPEQIKSLFYSRELPLTESGRKRPILHWVQAHRKRIKEGTEFDVEKYLRGTNEFIYNNTKFEIINPTKKKEKNE